MSWVRWLVMDSSQSIWVWVADSQSTEIGVSFNLEVSSFSPLVSPWVSDDVVWKASLRKVISNSKDSMVHILSGGSAIIRGEHTWSVVSEVRIDLVSKWDWSNVSKSVLEFFFVSWSDVNCTSDSDEVLFVIVSAVLIFSLIRIAPFSFNTSIMSDVLKSLRWETSTAPKVVKVTSTVDQLLLRELLRFGVWVSDLIVRFKGSNSGESPAWSALSLILDVSDNSLVSPVNLSWERSGMTDVVSFKSSGAALWVLKTEMLLEFFPAHVGVWVNSHLVSLVWLSIVSLDRANALFEVKKT